METINRGNCPLRQVRGRKFIRTQFTIEKPMLQALDAAATEKGLDSRSELVRSVLSDYLSKEQKQAA